jgi:hypothetical protein
MVRAVAVLIKVVKVPVKQLRLKKLDLNIWWGLPALAYALHGWQRTRLDLRLLPPFN